jgi:O-antigen/teichoic acid export membrane protein
MFVFGAPLAGSSLAAWVTSVSDRILLAGLAGSSAAGVYAAGYQIGSNIILLPASVVMAGAYPVLLQEYGTEGRDAASRMLSTLTSAAVVAGTAVVIAVMSTAPLLVSVLGPAFRQSSGIIPLVAGAQLLAVITEYYAKSFQLTNRTGRLFLVSAFAAVVSVTTNFALVPIMGMYGSAVATFIASGAALILTVRWGRPLLSFDLERTFALKVGAATAVSIAAARLLPPVINVASLPALATLIPVLAFGACLVAVREDTMIAALRSCTGRQLR